MKEKLLAILGGKGRAENKSEPRDDDGGGGGGGGGESGDGSDSGVDEENVPEERHPSDMSVISGVSVGSSKPVTEV